MHARMEFFFRVKSIKRFLCLEPQGWAHISYVLKSQWVCKFISLIGSHLAANDWLSAALRFPWLQCSKCKCDKEKLWEEIRCEGLCRIITSEGRGCGRGECEIWLRLYAGRYQQSLVFRFLIMSRLDLVEKLEVWLMSTWPRVKKP